ncbi:MAG: acyl-CoA carboxylase epsilon subunit [Streptomycetales bacterium]
MTSKEHRPLLRVVRGEPTEDELAALVTRDAMIGTAVVRAHEAAR